MKLHYFNEEGKELEMAPSEPGKYSVKASIPDLTVDNGVYASYLKWSESDNGEKEDEYYFYHEGAESETVHLTIKESSSVKPSDEKDKTAVDSNKRVSATKKKDAAKTKAAAKTGDTSRVTLYLLLLVAFGVVLAAVVQRRRRDYR